MAEVRMRSTLVVWEVRGEWREAVSREASEAAFGGEVIGNEEE